MHEQSSIELLLRASCEEIETTIKRLHQLSKGALEKKRGPGILTRHFWLDKGSRDSVRPKSESELELDRTTNSAHKRFSREMGTFSSHLSALEKKLHEEALQIGLHPEGEVNPDAPSRCPGSENPEFQLTELQRAAQRFFKPCCPPPMRRIMVELTPGMGKTCVYMEVIAKFLGKRNPETGDFFDIIILGDDEVFAAFNSLRSCPARVDIEEIVEWNTKGLKKANKGEDLLVRTVLYKRDDPKAPLPSSLQEHERYVSIKNINNDKRRPAKCALNTELIPSSGAKASPKSEAKATNEKNTTDTKEAPLEEKKSADQCGKDALLWRGSRVVMIPYAVAAKWVIFTGKGIPLLESPNGPVVTSKNVEGAWVEFPKADVKATPFKDKTTADQFHRDFGGFFTAKELGTGADGLLGAMSASGNGIYSKPKLDISSSNTLFIIDEVQNLSTPSKWGKGHHAAPYSPALSEALWRCTGDFCDEKEGTDAEPCREGRRKTPYIFAGTATPNTGTNPESTICLLQILNGKQRPHLFVPRWENGESTSRSTYESLKPRTLKEYRELLHDPKNRTSKILYWPPYSERKAKNLVVFPRTFLDEESKFVKDVTKEGNSGPFPLLDPRVYKGRVVEWTYDKKKYTYASAAKKVLSEKLLPEDSPDVSGKGAYREDVVDKTGKRLMHELAYKSFICAAKDDDLRFQYTRIYKPVYEDDLNRLFLQDMVATRVFTANSYFDYRVYPQVDPTAMSGDLSRPLTRLVIPKELLRCLPRCKVPPKGSFCVQALGTDLVSSKGTFVPDILAKDIDLTPRMRAEQIYPVAEVKSGNEVKVQYPWYVPPDSSEAFLKNLKAKPDPMGTLKDCRWSEWSLCSDLEKMKRLCVTLYEEYRDNVHDVNVDLENELRDFCARNCPKLVAAADDMYAYLPPGSKPKLNIFAPGLASESKSFFFMNASNRKGLNSNYFVVLASFYFRMRCRPYLQQLFKGHENMLPPVYRDGKATIQHRIAWLDALLLKEGDYSWIKTRKAVEKAYLRQFPQTDAKRKGRDPDLKNMRDWAIRKNKISFSDWGDERPVEDETLYPPWNRHDYPKTKAPPDSSEWFSFWATWLKGYGMRRSAYKSQELRATRTRLDAKGKGNQNQGSPTKPLRKLSSNPWALKFKMEQRSIEKNVEKAKKQLLEEKESPEDEQDKEELARLEKQAKRSTFFLRNRPNLAQRMLAQRDKIQELQTKFREAFYMPAIFSVGDSDMDIRREQDLHHKLHCIFTRELAQNSSWIEAVRATEEAAGEAAEASGYVNPPKKVAQRKDCGDSKLELSFTEVLELIGSPGLREAMVKAGMGWEPCVKSSPLATDRSSQMASAPVPGIPRESSAGQSMIFAGLAAHKALDFKCTGLNVAFGPQPRGQRIQEMGRNWRTCVNVPFVAIRQVFLYGEEDILKNDTLLDSFYQAQNEVLDWLRIITVSAGLGCSLWWGYSQWAKLLSSYRNMRPSETEWFFGKGKNPCLDSKGSSSSSKAALLDWYDKEGRERQEASSFYRCNRTNLTSKMMLRDTTKDYGRIVRSVVGAFSPDEITFDASKHPHDFVPDPSCRMGTAVELRTPASESTKYCLTTSEAAALTKPSEPPLPRLKMEHFMGGALKPHHRMHIEERNKMHAALTPEAASPNISHPATQHQAGALERLAARSETKTQHQTAALQRLRQRSSSSSQPATRHELEALERLRQRSSSSSQPATRHELEALERLRQRSSSSSQPATQHELEALERLRQRSSSSSQPATQHELEALERLRRRSHLESATPSSPASHMNHVPNVPHPPPDSEDHDLAHLLREAPSSGSPSSRPASGKMDADAILEKSRHLKARMQNLLGRHSLASGKTRFESIESNRH
jgi:hypothetical protein